MRLAASLILVLLMFGIGVEADVSAQIMEWSNTNRDAGKVTSFGYTTALPKTGALETLFAGTDEGGVYRSLNDGDDWFPTALVDVHTRALAVSDMNDALWVATYGNGAFRSDDLGETYTNPFSLLGGELDNVLSVAINTFTPLGVGDGDVFIGTDDNGIYYSSNDGATWTDITYNLNTETDEVIRSIVVKEDGAGIAGRDRVFVGTHGDGVWYIDYGAGSVLGAVWTEANGGETLDQSVVHAFTVEPSGVLYAGTDEGVFRSDDDGVNWTQVLDDVVARSLLVFTCGGTEYVMAGTDGDYVWRAATAVPGLWTQFNGLTAPPNGTVSGLRSSTVLALFFDEQEELLYAGTQDEGIHRSDDCGELWEQVSNLSLQDGYRVIQALLYDDQTGRLYGGTYGFGVIMSDDLGDIVLDWTSLNHGLTNPWVYSLALDRVNSMNYLYSGTWGDGVFRSTNGGETWLYSGLADRIVYDMDANDDHILFAATDLGEVYRTVDNGLTWQEIGVASTPIWALGIDHGVLANASDDVMYAGSFGDGAYKSTDQGFTWTQTGLTDAHVFDFTFGSVGAIVDAIFAATSKGVMYSTDDGTTWTVLNAGLTVVDARAVLFTGAELLVGTWGGGAFVYDVGLGKWVRDGMPGGHITTFAFNPGTGEVFSSLDDEGLFRKMFTPSVTATEDVLDGEVPDQFYLEQNYPNPFNPQTTIRFGLPVATETSLTIYDMLGRTVQVVQSGHLSAGIHEISFDAQKMAGGLYIFRLETPERMITRTMTLIK